MKTADDAKKDRACEVTAAWKRENRERYNAYMREYRKLNKERVNAISRKCYYKTKAERQQGEQV